MFSSYLTWLIIVSFLCFFLERLFPWRRKQVALRSEISQDLFWLLFNGYLFAVLFAPAYKGINHFMDDVFLLLFSVIPKEIALLSEMPFLMQFAVVLVVADFIEWAVHNALHRVSWLWKIHRMHHSIKTMDWIGNFRFHWGEAILYNSVKYIPLALLGAHWQVLLSVAVFATLIGHLNHSNLNISYGPFRYILNSPRMHIWHHEKELRGRAGVNFAVVFSLWDWLFGTAYMPRDNIQPSEIGFEGEEQVSHNIFMRFFAPFYSQPEQIEI